MRYAHVLSRNTCLGAGCPCPEVGLVRKLQGQLMVHDLLGHEAAGLPVGGGVDAESGSKSRPASRPTLIGARAPLAPRRPTPVSPVRLAAQLLPPRTPGRRMRATGEHEARLGVSTRRGLQVREDLAQHLRAEERVRHGLGGHIALAAPRRSGRLAKHSSGKDGVRAWGFEAASA